MSCGERGGETGVVSCGERGGETGVVSCGERDGETVSCVMWREGWTDGELCVERRVDRR